MISAEVAQLLGLPDYHVDTYNSFSVINYWCLIEVVNEVANIGSICEIGSDLGTTSKHLMKYAMDHGLPCYIVDPKVPESLDQFANELISICRTSSVEFLRDAPRCDLYIVDGDHNYWTVSRELAAIAGHAGGERPLVVVMHDTSWPCARRDSYYAAGRVPEPRAHRFDSGLNLQDQTLNDGQSYPGGDVFAWGEEYGVPEGGVLTAIEGSPLSDENRWWRLAIPSFYGVMILVEKAQLGPTGLKRLEQLMSATRILAPLLAIQEANRLRLLQGLMETQEELRCLKAQVAAGMKK